LAHPSARRLRCVFHATVFRWHFPAPGILQAGRSENKIVLSAGGTSRNARSQGASNYHWAKVTPGPDGSQWPATPCRFRVYQPQEYPIVISGENDRSAVRSQEVATPV